MDYLQIYWFEEEGRFSGLVLYCWFPVAGTPAVPLALHRRGTGSLDRVLGMAWFGNLDQAACSKVLRGSW